MGDTPQDALRGRSIDPRALLGLLLVASQFLPLRESGAAGAKSGFAILGSIFSNLRPDNVLAFALVLVLVCIALGPYAAGGLAALALRGTQIAFRWWLAAATLSALSLLFLSATTVMRSETSFAATYHPTWGLLVLAAATIGFCVAVWRARPKSGASPRTPAETKPRRANLIWWGGGAAVLLVGIVLTAAALRSGGNTSADAQTGTNERARSLQAEADDFPENDFCGRLNYGFSLLEDEWRQQYEEEWVSTNRPLQRPIIPDTRCDFIIDESNSPTIECQSRNWDQAQFLAEVDRIGACIVRDGSSYARPARSWGALEARYRWDTARMYRSIYVRLTPPPTGSASHTSKIVLSSGPR